MPDLKSFFEPKSIAIIGASNHSEKVGGILMKKILASNNIDKIIPINPKHAGEKIFGIKCYGSILDYKEKEKIDLAVIAVPAEFVSSAIEECGKKEIKNMIIISAGFSEVGNKDEEKKIVEIAKKFGIRILGPNCFGICNPTINLDLTFSLFLDQ